MQIQQKSFDKYFLHHTIPGIPEMFSTNVLHGTFREIIFWGNKRSTIKLPTLVCDLLSLDWISPTNHLMPIGRGPK